MAGDSAMSARAPEPTFPEAARGAMRAQTPIGDPDDDDWEEDDDLDDEDEDEDDDEEPMQLGLASPERQAPALACRGRGLTRYGLRLSGPRRWAR